MGEQGQRIVSESAEGNGQTGGEHKSALEA